MGNFQLSSGGGLFTPASASIPFASNAARDAWAAANRSDLIQGQTAVSVSGVPNSWYIWNGVTDPAVYNNADWVDGTPVIQGPAGANGASGNSYFFAGIAERDAFFTTGSNSLLLEKNLPCTVNEGGVTVSYYWSGANSPVSYDENLWLTAELGTSAAALILGSDGARVGGGLHVLNYATPAHGGLLNGIFTPAEYDDTGNLHPYYYDMGPLVPFVVTSVADTIKPAPNALVFTSTITSFTRKFTVIPASFGTLRVQSWYGTDDVNGQIQDYTFEVEPADVGVPLELAIPNPTMAETGDQQYVIFSGVDLYGGLQTS